jgi:hypothetical protein
MIVRPMRMLVMLVMDLAMGMFDDLMLVLDGEVKPDTEPHQDVDVSSITNHDRCRRQDRK